MLQGMDDMEASWVFCDKVGMFDQLEQIKLGVITVTKMGLVMLTIQHGLSVIVSVMEYPGDCLRQTSPDVLSLDEFPVYI